MWISPDNRIKKETIKDGLFGLKPWENAICSVDITEVTFQNSIISDYIVDTEIYPIEIVVGNGNTALDREIDKCLQTMHSEELSLFIINLPENEIKLTIKLCCFESRGYIFEWKVQDKFEIAQNHKQNGIELFKENRYIDASIRFTKGLKLLLSIPIAVDRAPQQVDGIDVSEIEQFRANLYNNLASCFSKVKKYDDVINLCTRVLEIDENNVKAFHKRGFAYSVNRAFEKARDDLNKVLELDAENQAAKEKLQYVNHNLSLQEADFASIVKKMFK